MFVFISLIGYILLVIGIISIIILSCKMKKDVNYFVIFINFVFAFVGLILVCYSIRVESQHELNVNIKCNSLYVEYSNYSAVIGNIDASSILYKNIIEHNPKCKDIIDSKVDVSVKNNLDKIENNVKRFVDRK